MNTLLVSRTVALFPAGYTAHLVVQYFGGWVLPSLILSAYSAYAVWLLVTAVLRLLLRPLEPPRELPYREHWATREEVRTLLLSSGQEGRGVVLAHHQAGLIGVRPGTGGQSEMGHFLVSGPSRAGKGLHLVTNLLRWQGSAVTVDIKGENYQKTAGHRQRFSRVRVLDPSGYGDCYDPFVELGHTDEGLHAAALLILEPEQDKERIFAERAANALFAGMLAARKLGRPTLAYLRELTALGLAGYVRQLHSLNDPQIRRALVDFLGKTPEQFSPEDMSSDRFLNSSWMNLVTRMRPLFSEGILRMTSGSDFRAADLITGSTSLYLVFKESTLRFTAKALQVIQLGMIDALIRYGDEGHSGSTPVIFFFDEAGRVPVPRLEDLVSTIAGRGMSAVIYIQSLSQLEGKYGREAAATIRDNCHTQMFYPPRDKATAEYISEMTGEVTLVEVDESERVESDGFGTDKTRRETFRQRPLITPAEVRQLPKGTVVIFAQDLPPIKAQRLEYYRYPWAKPIASLAAPKPQPLGALEGLPLPHIAPETEMDKGQIKRRAKNIGGDEVEF